MQKITSFTVDHRFIDEGIFVSRVDDDITTYDIRTKKPNTGDLMDNQTMHTVEHLFATFVRNSEIKENVIYFGPMGCQTGFYLLLRNVENNVAVAQIKDIFTKISDYSGEIPGNSEIECGNYKSLHLKSANDLAREFSQKIKDQGLSEYK